MTLPEKRWKAQHPDRIQLFSLATPNGQKAGIALEELELPYEAHKIDIMAGDQKDPEYLELVNPNGKIPAIIDPHGMDGNPLGLWESGAILIYLAEKTGRFIPSDHHARYRTIQWLMFQMGGIGPMFGQFGHFHSYGGANIEDPYALERYKGETQRLLTVLNERLQNRTWIMGNDYTIADIASWPWVRALTVHYEARETLALSNYPNVTRWLNLCLERSASVAVLNR